ncbi:3,4-dihydroxy-2-butanone 4-phosphate synthase [Spinactinospora alkalitolerans]|uniref:3,4-dihydroxy-2-butanone-4-phosphate synthase n=1 Tax=Spinactinospora alkalitolerans TaxID=687207 RepID=A0A852TYP3_9ACTN|nr:3,4-dihydroxy-2-butanone-4-phosphate synthase [Spinactinospora alkalitolerans]NYE47913.1 3,4-dihydroxy-2-butanone 4-phosphate synthase [Spinactinospora alkalitolerans]
MSLSSIDKAVATLARGGRILVLDDEDRENEGGLIMAAEHAGTDDVAFFLEHTSGFLCIALDARRAADLEID